MIKLTIRKRWLRYLFGTNNGTSNYLSSIGDTDIYTQYINDISKNISSTANLFADECNIHRRIQGPEDKTLLQEDIDQLCSKARRWQMLSNPDRDKEKAFAILINSVLEYAGHTR